MREPAPILQVETANVDTKTGFNHVYENIYYEASRSNVSWLFGVQDGVRKRDAYRMFGIRVVTSATGASLVLHH